MSMDSSLLAAQNIHLRQQLLEQAFEIANWKKNYDDLAMKYNQLKQQKVYLKDFEELDQLKINYPKLVEREFHLSQQVILIGAENSRLHAVILELQDKVDDLELKVKKFEVLKTQYQTLQSASQKLHSELEQLRCAPPKVMTPNPNMNFMQQEINRLNKIILQLRQEINRLNNIILQLQQQLKV